MLFGGPHQSLPSFQRAGVQPGDRIYPVRAHRARLHVLGVLEVTHIVPCENVGSALPDRDLYALGPQGLISVSVVAGVVARPRRFRAIASPGR